MAVSVCTRLKVNLSKPALSFTRMIDFQSATVTQLSYISDYLCSSLCKTNRDFAIFSLCDFLIRQERSVPIQQIFGARGTFTLRSSPILILDT